MSRTTVPESGSDGPWSPGLGSVTVEQIMQALASVQDPEIRRPITDLGMVKNVEVGTGGAVRVDVYLTVSGCPLRDTITRDVKAALANQYGASTIPHHLHHISPHH